MKWKLITDVNLLTPNSTPSPIPPRMIQTHHNKQNRIIWWVLIHVYRYPGATAHTNRKRTQTHRSTCDCIYNQTRIRGRTLSLIPSNWWEIRIGRGADFGDLVEDVEEKSVRSGCWIIHYRPILFDCQCVCVWVENRSKERVGIEREFLDGDGVINEQRGVDKQAEEQAIQYEMAKKKLLSAKRLGS